MRNQKIEYIQVPRQSLGTTELYCRFRREENAIFIVHNNNVKKLLKEQQFRVDDLKLYTLNEFLNMKEELNNIKTVYVDWLKKEDYLKVIEKVLLLDINLIIYETIDNIKK